MDESMRGDKLASKQRGNCCGWGRVTRGITQLAKRRDRESATEKWRGTASQRAKHEHTCEVKTDGRPFIREGCDDVSSEGWEMGLAS